MGPRERLPTAGSWQQDHLGASVAEAYLVATAPPAPLPWPARAGTAACGPAARCRRRLPGLLRPWRNLQPGDPPGQGRARSSGARSPGLQRPGRPAPAPRCPACRGPPTAQSQGQDQSHTSCRPSERGLPEQQDHQQLAWCCPRWTGSTKLGVQRLPAPWVQWEVALRCKDCTRAQASPGAPRRPAAVRSLAAEESRGRPAAAWRRRWRHRASPPSPARAAASSAHGRARC
mmetsp:Transcript_103799/g.289093  ORF Transcript_103799/g.289093 Transcript_103799/m.289093 type:complete len:231 (-) Transcript_103799:763-1455(-)